jgi:hypothetical protein
MKELGFCLASLDKMASFVKQKRLSLLIKRKIWKKKALPVVMLNYF